MTCPYRECRTAEADVGMSYYLSDVDGTGGRLKKDPEDFIVKEISDGPEPTTNGRFVIAEITTRNWETNRLVRLLSRSLGISRERIGFAGTKDKRAITTQLMSFECPIGFMERIALKDVEIRNTYTAKKGIQIGDLKGNSFTIKVRECDMHEKDIPHTIDIASSAVKETGGFPNYFGVQRFGAVRPITHKVGESIVRGDIEGAVRSYVSDPSMFEDEDAANARISLSKEGDWASALKEMPDSLSYEKIMVEHMVSSPDDWKGAIEKLPKNLQMMFVHAYQSYLFNLMLSRRMELGIPLDRPVEGDVVIPLDADRIPMHERPVTVTAKNIELAEKQLRSGKAFLTISLFGTESRIADGQMGEIERNVIEGERMTNGNFMVPGLPYCCSKGSRREIICPVDDIRHSVTDDGYNVKFSLPKGNYATCLLREYMKAEMISY
jgi:tRNA pseudouridine13 synthase